MDKNSSNNIGNENGESSDENSQINYKKLGSIFNDDLKKLHDDITKPNVPLEEKTKPNNEVDSSNTYKEDLKQKRKFNKKKKILLISLITFIVIVCLFLAFPKIIDFSEKDFILNNVKDTIKENTSMPKTDIKISDSSENKNDSIVNNISNKVVEENKNEILNEYYDSELGIIYYETTEGFEIQTGLYKNNEFAEKELERLKKLGFDNAYLEDEVTNNRIIYRVKIGLYKTLEEAKANIKALID